MKDWWCKIMAYETKVILVGIANYIKARKEIAKEDASVLKALKSIYEYVSDMANVEGIIIKPFDEND